MCWRHSGCRRKEPNRRTNSGALAERRGGGRRRSNDCAEYETCTGVARDRKGVATYEGDEQAVFRKMLSAKIKYRSGKARMRRGHRERWGQQ
jgi:hypothetical protein